MIKKFQVSLWGLTLYHEILHLNWENGSMSPC